MISFVVGLSVSMVLILFLERLAKPYFGPRPILRRISLLSAMPPVVFYVTMFMITYRPVFSTLMTLVVFAGIVVINNAKVAILREPLVFSDFALLRQAIRYPALYIRYVGVGKVVGVAAAGVALVVGAIVVESPVIARPELDDFFPLLIYLATVFGMIYAVTRGPLREAFSDFLRGFGPTADVRKDIDKLSLVVCLIFYFFLANEPSPAQPVPVRPQMRRRRVVTLGRTDMVVVQSESFFDARRIHDSIPQDLLARFDACSEEASYHGRLSVPAWGANTMRTEFAFLSGLPNEALGYHRFNPYLSLCKKPVWTMAQSLRSMGYRTICVHPFHASFFDRETVYPNLGFDRFLDIESFGGAETFGPYVSDVAVADKMLSVLDEDDDRPAFIFAITMENHGKWERGRLDDCPADEAIGDAPLNSHELGLYLRHLRNTDLMVDRLWGELKRRDGDSVFCLYGDHLPPFSPLFHQVGLTDQRTDYFVWRKNGGHPRMLDTSADVLGRLVMDAAFNGPNHESVPSVALAGE